jgi:hypothetical protein
VKTRPHGRSSAKSEVVKKKACTPSGVHALELLGKLY